MHGGGRRDQPPRDGESPEQQVYQPGAILATSTLPRET